MNRSRKLLSVLGFVPLMVAFCGCGPATRESIDAANLVGRWELVSNGETEWFDLAADGSFTATIDRDGFIATTLSQGPHVTTGRTDHLPLAHRGCIHRRCNLGVPREAQGAFR